MTLRARLEAIRDRHGATLANQDDFLTYSDAVAALAILDESTKHEEWIDVPGLGEIRHDTRMVPDS